jgi:hypothetical protein
MSLTSDELQIRFTYHAPKPGQPELYLALRSKAKELAELIVQSTPESREQSLALTSLEEATFWANSAIARRS